MTPPLPRRPDPRAPAPHRAPEDAPAALRRRELRRIVALAAPVAATQLGTMLLGVVDLLMLGHLGTRELAAAALGRVWVLGTMLVAQGILFGLDPVISQAFGARKRERMGLALQQGLVLASVLSLLLAGLFLVTDDALRAFGQDPELAAIARRYAVARIPGLPFLFVFLALRSWLQGRGLMAPALAVAWLSNLVNVAANWGLIFGHLGLPRLEVVGAGLATSLTQAFSCLALVLVVRARRLDRGAWTGWRPEALSPRGWLEIARLGWPIGVQFGLEVWAFQFASLAAGWLGEVELAAHTVVLNLASVTFMLPLGVSIGAATRVGNLIGAGRRAEAQRAAHVALVLGAAVMAVSALVFVVGREALPRLYGAEEDVLRAAAAILPIAAAFQVFDGIQVVGGGVLRGMGRTRPAALFNLVGYYAIAFPLAWWLAFRRGFGLAGLWWSIAVGLGVVAIALVAWIRRRGPAWAESLEATEGRRRARADQPPQSA